MAKLTKEEFEARQEIAEVVDNAAVLKRKQTAFLGCLYFDGAALYRFDVSLKNSGQQSARITS